jgi:hypothetical protein
MRKFDTVQRKDEWFTPFENDKDVKIKVRAFSILHLSKLPSSNQFGIAQLFDIFMSCVVDWKGILDSKDDKPLECNDENKKKVFEQDTELQSLVVSHVISLKAQVVKEEEVKNLSTSQPGKETKQEK